jgi:hypothetical protein
LAVGLFLVCLSLALWEKPTTIKTKPVGPQKGAIQAQ